jgi:hypothetical protein
VLGDGHWRSWRVPLPPVGFMRAWMLLPFALLLPIGHALPRGHVWPALIAMPPALALIHRFIHVPRGRQFNRVLVQTVLQSLFSLLLALGLVL